MTGDHLITARISHIGECLSVLHQRLSESGYRFADPPLNDEWHHTTFLMYLEICLQYAGFPGLADAPDHNWPIHELARGL